MLMYSISAWLLGWLLVHQTTRPDLQDARGPLGELQERPRHHIERTQPTPTPGRSLAQSASLISVARQDSGHILRDFVGTFNPNYTRWNDEFELDAATRPDAIRKSFYIPYLDKNTAKMVVRVFCKYTSDLADGTLVLARALSLSCACLSIIH